MILLRHGQSEFNLHFTATRQDPGIEDPGLTEQGHAQAAAAAAALAARPLRRLIVSPYTRTLQTAAPMLAQRRLDVEISPDIRERFHFTCDIGSPPDRLAARFPEHDFAHLPQQWWPGRTESEAAVIERANRFRSAMAARPDWRETIVVSHWAFILALTGQSLTNGTWIEYDPASPPPSSLTWRP
ncbi:MAG TPA: histidine phosphatase family protein [Acidiphilium sp.]|jgi:broad specificity phosphatase PhoE|uniref:histidine phosphatase family protein n=1 Tax=unclassified Acidiphilium TaxID=2617493 RepID=UPI000BCC775D|nr:MULTISPECIES: histidine phosphatase family protein [unclassified Acidiphilium]OYV57195.1 MAG: histidine phosphatase family protein [Acidiphilium sp. 20-67-58]OYV86489.1 MAG: histidine phosphatase family protein [Acidiphilium sp. 21-68-69]HQT60603.1 histidine phosphatase family protein [Acidiphilium sp.]HQU11069.1 histidine phosphatase family protein [Acidiphilium sp.]